MYVNGIGTPKDIIEAERWYRLAIKQGHIMAMNNLAYMFSENDMNLDEAEKLSRATLETNPERAMFLDTLGWVLHKNGKYQEAIELLKRAVSLKQRNSEYRRHLNAVLLAAGDGGETVSCDTIEARDAYKLGLEIQQTVRESDLQALFSLVEEELTHGPRKSAVQGRSFSEVFSSKWKEMVLSAKPDCQPVGWRGYMLGHGMIWYRAEGIFSINDAQILIKACPALSGWTGFSKQSTGYSPDKEFLLSVDTDPKTEDIHVKLKTTKGGETKILEIMEKQHFGSLGSRDEGIMENRVQFSKQGSLVAVSGESASNVSLYDTSSWKKVGSFEYAAFSLSPNGKFLAVSGFNWKFGWDLSIFEIDNKGKEFAVGGRRLIGGRDWCGSADKNGCAADRISGLCLNGNSECSSSEWYIGQEFRFSEDGNYLVIDALDTNYIAYDLRKNTLRERSCTQ